MKGKWSPGKVTAVVLGGIGAGIVLAGSFCLGVTQLAKDVLAIQRDGRRMEERARREKSQDTRSGIEDWLREHGDRSYYYDYGDDGYNYDYDDDYFYDDGDDYFYDDGNKDESIPSLPRNPESYDSGNNQYYEFHDAIREGLSYQVEFENFSSLFGENVQVDMNYPVITGKTASELSVINNAIQEELQEVKEYGEYVAEWISEEQSYSFQAESYVTYMDEKLLSVAYVEYGYLDNEVYESYVITANIDMENGMALTNSQILDIDDAFSVDFRNRCEAQNGEIDSLSMYSDQDITDMLTNDDSLIIAYTPVGMEIGFNYYYGWVTVTYQDYQKFQKSF